MSSGFITGSDERSGWKTYIPGDAMLRKARGQFGGGKALATVLGDTPCAKDCFVTHWLGAAG